jgi:hypothetical protein
MIRFWRLYTLQKILGMTKSLIFMNVHRSVKFFTKNNSLTFFEPLRLNNDKDSTSNFISQFSHCTELTHIFFAAAS